MSGRRSGGEARLERHARRVIRARWWVIAAWAVLVAAAIAAIPAIATTGEVTLPGTESQEGRELIQQAFGDGETSSVQPVFVHPTLVVTDPAYAGPVTASIERAARVVRGTTVVSFYSTGSPDLVGDDGHLTFVTLRLPLGLQAASEAVPEIRRALGRPEGFEPVLVGGEAAAEHDLAPIVDEDLRRAELFAIPLALLILVLAFGTLASAALPLVSAGVTIIGGLGAMAVVGQFLDLAVFVPNVVLLIGLGIGVDYALLLVARFREELARGQGREQALVRTMATAGHSVLFSGAAVTIGLAVLVLLRVPFIQSMGIAGMMVPIVAVAAGLTLMPALLYVMGERVNALRVLPRSWLLGTAGNGWGRLADWVMRHARAVFAVTAAVLVALAIPATQLSVHQNQLEDAPQQSEAVQAGLVLQRSLGGAATPDILVIDTGRAGGFEAAAVRSEVTRFALEMRLQPPVRGVGWPLVTPGATALAGSGLVDPTGRYGLLAVAPLGDPLSDSGREVDALLNERKGSLEAALPGEPAVLLTGQPALLNDFNQAVNGPFPWLVLVVLAFTFLTLLRAFRSVVLPIKAVIANVLSILATYGLIVIVFQWGVGSELLGVDHDVRGVAAWIPIFLFAFLFGLSMDYEVFLITRMREIHDDGASTREAVARGLQRTGRIVTSAALIMIVAFSGFITGSGTDLKVFGFGLAAGIAIDATIVRVLLVPSLMRLMGRWNWVLPARLARLARVRPSRDAPPPARGEAGP